MTRCLKEMLDRSRGGEAPDKSVGRRDTINIHFTRAGRCMAGTVGTARGGLSSLDNSRDHECNVSLATGARMYLWFRFKCVILLHISRGHCLAP